MMFWKRRKDAKQKFVEAASKSAVRYVKRFELSEKLAVQIFQREGGFYYLRKYEDGSGWVPPLNMGDGSAYDTLDKAQRYARELAK
jgi:hypothetical protein